jgi:hypothetical protein
MRGKHGEWSPVSILLYTACIEMFIRLRFDIPLSLLTI